MKKGIRVSAKWRFAILLAVLFGLGVQPALAREIYSWTDENGVVHYSDSKPVTGESKPINVAEPPEASQAATAPDTMTSESRPEMPTAAQQKRMEIAGQRETEREKQLAVAEMCAKHEKRLEQMEPARRVYYTDDDGQEVRMDDIERVGLIEESRDYIAQNCH